MARSNTIKKVREILEAAGDIKTMLQRETGNIVHEVLRHQVLVATHPGEKYHSGTTILRTDTSLKENEFQGTVGLVIGLGPLAFKDDDVAKFGGAVLNLGDWVLYRPADGLSLYINELPCRLFDDVSIKMKVTDPAMYW